MTLFLSSVSAAKITSWLCARAEISYCATAMSPLVSRYWSVLCRRDISCASRFRAPSCAARSACGTKCSQFTAVSVAAKPSRISGTVTFSDVGSGNFNPGSLLQVLERPRREHRLDLDFPRQQFRFDHQRHQPLAGDRQLRRLAAEHLQVLGTRRNMQPVQGSEELLAARLLPDPHSPRRVGGLALQVVERGEPAGQQRLDRLRLFLDRVGPDSE